MLVCLVTYATSAQADSRTFTAHRGERICLFEQTLATELRRVAERYGDSHHPRATEYLFETSDRYNMRGYLIKSTHPTNKGIVLVAVGNAMIVGPLTPYFLPMADDGFDVLLMNYRGYGDPSYRTPPMLSDLFVDFDELLQHLARSYAKRHYLGFSLGGIVLAYAIRGDPDFERLIIDSSPAKLPFLCSGDADLINLLNVPVDRLSFISGGKDTVVKERQMQSLFRKFPQASVIREPELHHPFMYGDEPVRMKRWLEIFNRSPTSP